MRRLLPATLLLPLLAACGGGGSSEADYQSVDDLAAALDCGDVERTDNAESAGLTPSTTTADCEFGERTITLLYAESASDRDTDVATATTIAGAFGSGEIHTVTNGTWAVLTETEADAETVAELTGGTID